MRWRNSGDIHVDIYMRHSRLFVYQKCCALVLFPFLQERNVWRRNSVDRRISTKVSLSLSFPLSLSLSSRILLVMKLFYTHTTHEAFHSRDFQFNCLNPKTLSQWALRTKADLYKCVSKVVILPQSTNFITPVAKIFAFAKHWQSFHSLVKLSKVSKTFINSSKDNWNPMDIGNFRKESYSS